MIRDLDDVFPLVVRDARFAASGSLGELIGQPAAQFSGEHETMLTGYLIRLNETNHNIQADFRATYAVYKVKPCERDQYLEDGIRRAQEEQRHLAQCQFRLATITALAAANPTSPELPQLLREFLQLLGGKDAAPTTKDEMVDANSDAQSWIEGVPWGE